jgi:hypothetical protein
VSLFELDGTPHAFICNAGDSQGAVVVNLRSNQVVSMLAVPVVLEQPWYHAGTRTLFAATADVTRRRDNRGITTRPQSERSLYALSFPPRASGRASDANDSRQIRAEISRIPLPLEVHRCGLVADSLFLLVAAGTDAQRLMVFDLRDRKVTSDVEAFGSVQRIEH